uniref:CSON005279 protein n=1 Tax=Culicoides sonorensis TaxID=179676 RepID=A0A336MVB8_CULSO
MRRVLFKADAVDLDENGWKIDHDPNEDEPKKLLLIKNGINPKRNNDDDSNKNDKPTKIDPMQVVQKMELQRCVVQRATFAFKSKIVKQKSVIIPDKFYIHDSLRDLGDKDAETKAEVLKTLHREILYVPSSLLEERDKSDMCLLHRILLTFPKSLKKDDHSNEMIKLVLMKSNTNFKQEDRKILRLLKSYDKQEPYSVKFFQQQILNNQEAGFMLRMLRSEEERQHAIGIQKNFRDLLEVAFAIGNVTTVEYLVKQGRQFYKPGELEYPVLTVAILSSIYVKAEYKEKYFKCVDYVLFQADTDINARDINGNTALHIVNDDIVLQKILRKKPMISIQNKKGQFPFHNVTLDLLTNILNSIVTNVPSRIMDDPNFWEVIKTKELALKNMIFIDFTALCPEDVNILDFIKEIETTKHLTTAINHSVVTTMLELSWMEFKQWIKLERQAMFVALFFAMLLFFVQDKTYVVILGIMTSLVLVFEVLKVYRCFLQFISNKYKRLIDFLNEKRKFWMEAIKTRSLERANSTKDTENEEEVESSQVPEEFVPMYRIYTFLLLDLPLLLLLMLYSIYSYHDKDCDWIIGLATILSAFNITIFHSFFNEMVANYLIMLLHVAFNGFRFLLSTSFILLGFALSFMKLINNFDSAFEHEIDSMELKKNKTEILSVGKSITLSILKTIVMATGELEAATLEFHYMISYLIFVLFIFAIPIVFMNLLNGLALEDVQQIKKEAKFLYRKFQLMFLCEVDYLIENKGFLKGINFNTRPNLLKDFAFIGIKTTTCDIYSFEKINKHRRIGKLNPTIVKEISEILNNQRKAYMENGK